MDKGTVTALEATAAVFAVGVVLELAYAWHADEFGKIATSLAVVAVVVGSYFAACAAKDARHPRPS